MTVPSSWGQNTEFSTRTVSSKKQFIHLNEFSEVKMKRSRTSMVRRDCIFLTHFHRIEL